LEITPGTGFIDWLAQQMLRRKADDHWNMEFTGQEPVSSPAQVLKAGSLMAKRFQRFAA